MIKKKHLLLFAFAGSLLFLNASAWAMMGLRRVFDMISESDLIITGTVIETRFLLPESKHIPLEDGTFLIDFGVEYEQRLSTVKIKKVIWGKEKPKGVVHILESGTLDSFFYYEGQSVWVFLVKKNVSSEIREKLTLGTVTYYQTFSEPRALTVLDMPYRVLTDSERTKSLEFVTAVEKLVQIRKIKDPAKMLEALRDAEKSPNKILSKEAELQLQKVALAQQILAFQKIPAVIATGFLSPERLNVNRKAEHTFKIHINTLERIDVSVEDAAQVRVDNQPVDAEVFSTDVHGQATHISMKVFVDDLQDIDPTVTISSINNIHLVNICMVGPDPAITLRLDTFSPSK